MPGRNGSSPASASSKYGGEISGRLRVLLLAWRRSFTLSMGATAVLEMAAEMPPAKKSLPKDIAVSRFIM